jgi:ribosomal protein S18 acetylase RimI-like enzyme
VSGFKIERVGAGDLDALAPLMRAYCDFYRAAASEAALRALAETLLADPQGSGLQLIAREQDSKAAVGFATLYWSYSTLSAGPIGVMNDLYVAPEARRRGIATALIEACREQTAQHGRISLEWYTAPDNLHAQAAYERTGAEREEWFSYTLSVAPEQH